MRVPISRTEKVERTYYDCGRKLHRHRSVKSCSNCIARHPNLQGMKKYRNMYLKRDLRITRLVLTGGKGAIREVAEKIDLSKTRVSQIVLRYVYRSVWLEIDQNPEAWKASGLEPYQKLAYVMKRADKYVILLDKFEESLKRKKAVK